MAKGFDLKCGAGKTARVWPQGKDGGLSPGQAFVLLPPNTSDDAGYIAPLRSVLLDCNKGHVNVVVCRRDGG